jgi:hypothetical protein
VGDVNGDSKPDIVGKNYDGAKSVDAWVNVADVALGVSVPPPAPFELLGNNPNPFNRHTTIRFRMDAPGNVRLSVYDVNGRLIRNLADGWRDVGQHAVAWDGRTVSGRPARVGLYFCRIEFTGSTASASQTQKLLVMR